MLNDRESQVEYLLLPLVLTVIQPGALRDMNYRIYWRIVTDHDMLFVLKGQERMSSPSLYSR